MNRLAMLTLTAVGLLCLAVVTPATDGLAQQKQKVSYKVAAENTKYTQQFTIAVGDVPGHEIRISEIHRTFPTNAPMINGVRLKEIWPTAGGRGERQHRRASKERSGRDHETSP